MVRTTKEQDTKDKKKILSLLPNSHKGALTAYDLEKKMDICYHRIKRLISQLIKEGRIASIGNSKTTFYWRVSP